MFLPIKNSPYIANSNRLADVIAAIQAMGSYGFHMASFERWAERISGDSSMAGYWKTIFEQHPEFFRLDTTRKMASLVWRRQQLKNFDPELNRVLTAQEMAHPRPNQKLSRPPLDPSSVQTLIGTAIGIHASAVELQRNRRWWIPLVASAVGALIGAYIGVHAGSK